jgi:hypothetical protein
MKMQRALMWLGGLGLWSAGACSSAQEGLGQGSPCTADAECASGLACLSGSCQPDPCGSCGPDEICSEAHQCVPQLTGCDEVCAAGTYCSAAGECIPDGTCQDDADCGTGLVCDEDAQVCVPGGDCGANEFEITKLPPNLLIVLDRSGSMDAEVPNSGGQTRWEVAGAAIAQLLVDYAATVSFGLDLFSACTGNGCAPGTIVLPIGSAPADIDQTIAQTALCDSGDPETVIGGSLQALVGEASLQVAGRDNAILLITDGQDNCGGGGPQAAAALLGQPVAVTTYVVGFSGDVNAGELDAIAQAAGTAPYYQADDAMQLSAALSSIAASVASCSYTLDMPPEGDIYVFFNDDPQQIPQDGQDGWTYDPSTNTITFHGAACDQIQNGIVTDIDIVFGCAAPTPE